MDNSFYDLWLMAGSGGVTIAIKLFLFVAGVLAVQLLLALMDRRSAGGFGTWRAKVMGATESNTFCLAILGFYYILRFAVLYLCMSLLFSS